ncbi:maltose phosphorylase, partial [Klebsiella oxytoca]
TNGITFRRWLLHCNHSLADYITGKIGAGYKKDVKELEKMGAFDDEASLRQLLEIKHQNKRMLKHYLMETQGIEIDE